MNKKETKFEDDVIAFMLDQKVNKKNGNNSEIMRLTRIKFNLTHEKFMVIVNKFINEKITR